ELDLLAEKPVALQRERLDGVEQTAVTLAVDVLHRQRVALELVETLLGIGAGLRHVETEDDLAFGRIVAELFCPCALGKEIRRCQGRTGAHQQGSPVHSEFRHSLLLRMSALNGHWMEAAT